MIPRIICLALPGVLIAPLVGVPGLGPTGTDRQMRAYAASEVRTAEYQPAARSRVPTSLAVEASGSLLKASGGLFRSKDGGRSWQSLSVPAALHPEKLRRVATIAAAPSRIYAAGPGAGVIRSDNGGKTWRTVTSGLPSSNVVAFSVHSYLPDTLYTWFKGKGIYRSQSGGSSWGRIDTGPPTTVEALAHSTLPGSMNTGWLYATTPQGIYLSMDCF